MEEVLGEVYICRVIRSGLNFEICGKGRDEWRLRLQRCRSKCGIRLVRFSISMVPRGGAEFQTLYVNAWAWYSPTLKDQVHESLLWTTTFLESLLLIITGI